ncbi:MAG: hypothetical protein NTX53_04435 [candidate division WOR-3 bacterium]|nr:hypothetical protein [candidate division WOR-3 bacterium]
MRTLSRPFSRLDPSDPLRPWLPVSVANPNTGQKVSAYALIDTGADACALPAYLAPMLGLRLKSGGAKRISTGGGDTTAYSHRVSLELPEDGYATGDIAVDFMTGLTVPLLGVANFLSEFVLVVDYPRKRFSLTLRPGAATRRPRPRKDLTDQG